MRTRVPSRSLKTPVSRRAMSTFHAVLRNVLHTLATTAVAMRRAAVRGQVRGHSANPRHPLSHLPTTSCHIQRPTVSAKVAEDSLAASLGFSGAVAVPSVAIPGQTSGRREQNQIYEPCDAPRIVTARTTPLQNVQNPRADGYSVGVPHMIHRRPHYPHRARSSKSAAHGRGRRRRIKAGSAMAAQLEVGMRARDPSRDVPLYQTHRLALHRVPPARQRTHAHPR
jgi:hypothetical protein